MRLTLTFSWGVDPRYCYSQILQGLPGQGHPCGGATSDYYYTHYGVFLLLQGLSAAAVFTSPDPDALPVRFLYMLPLQVFEAVGFISVVRVMLSLHNGLAGTKGHRLLIAVALVSVVAPALAFAFDNDGFFYRGIPGTWESGTQVVVWTRGRPMRSFDEAPDV
jgi:hypothetical protein